MIVTNAKKLVMAGLDPATQCARVGARKRLMLPNFSTTLARENWVAGSSPAMTEL
mgnify:CR=1 FL=1